MRKFCCIPTCRNEEYPDGNIYFHKFPKDENMRFEWFKRCGRVGRINYNVSSVCSEHFTKDDYIQDIRLFERFRPRLKPTAIPALKCSPLDVHDPKSIDLPPCSSDLIDLPHDFTENPVSESSSVINIYSSNTIEDMNEICKQLYWQRYFPDMQNRDKEGLNIKRKSSPNSKRSRKRGKISVSQRLRRRREKQNIENVSNMFNEYFEDGLTASEAMDRYADSMLENESSNSFHPTIKEANNMFAAWKQQKIFNVTNLFHEYFEDGLTVSAAMDRYKDIMIENERSNSFHPSFKEVNKMFTTWKRQKSFEIIGKFYNYFDDGFNASQAVQKFEDSVLQNEDDAPLYPSIGQVNLMYKNWKKMKDLQSCSNEQNAADKNMDLGTPPDDNMELGTPQDENMELGTPQDGVNCAAPNSSTNTLSNSSTNSTTAKLDDKSKILPVDIKTILGPQLTTEPPVSISKRVPIYTPSQIAYLGKEPESIPVKASRANYLKRTRVTFPQPSSVVLNTATNPVNGVNTGIRIKEEPPFEENPEASTSTSENVVQIPRIQNVFSMTPRQNSLQNSAMILPNITVIRNGATMVDNSVQTDDDDVQLLLSLLPDLKRLPRSHKVNIKNKMQDIILASRVSARRDSLKHLKFSLRTNWKPKQSKKKGISHK